MTQEAPCTWGEWIDYRIDDLGIDIQDIAAAAGMSVETLRKYRRDEFPKRGLRRKLRKLARALEWQEDAFERIAHGLEPLALAEPPTPLHLVVDDADGSGDVDEVIGALRDDIERRLWSRHLLPKDERRTYILRHRQIQAVLGDDVASPSVDG